MPTRYLLPCSCGDQLTIEIGQAGQEVNCDGCGATIEVPTMRGVRELKPLPEKEDEKPRVEWTPLQGTLFATGILVTLIALSVAGFVWMKRWQIGAQTAKPLMPDTTLSDTHLEQMTADQVLDLWKEGPEKVGLGDWETPTHLTARKQARVWLILQIVTLVVAAGGVATSVAAFYKMPQSTLPKEV